MEQEIRGITIEGVKADRIIAKEGIVVRSSKNDQLEKNNQLLELILEQLLELKKAVYTSSGCDIEEMNEFIKKEKEQINLIFNSEEGKRLYEFVKDVEK